MRLTRYDKQKHSCLQEGWDFNVTILVYIYTHTYIHSIELKLGRRLGAALIDLDVGLG